MSSYDATTKVEKIFYNIGEPEVTGGLYVFDETPVCNYAETVTIQNLPNFVTHNESLGHFTIAQNNDLSLIGGYTVTILSEIQIPDDYTASSFTTLSVEYDFFVQIEKCIITKYQSTSILLPMTYIIGDPGIISPSYSFDETPICNYKETVSVTGLPAFVQHKENDATFGISKVEDLALDG